MDDNQSKDIHTEPKLVEVSNFFLWLGKVGVYRISPRDSARYYRRTLPLSGQLQNTIMGLWWQLSKGGGGGGRGGFLCYPTMRLTSSGRYLPERDVCTTQADLVMVWECEKFAIALLSNRGASSTITGSQNKPCGLGFQTGITVGNDPKTECRKPNTISVILQYRTGGILQ